MITDERSEESLPEELRQPEAELLAEQARKDLLERHLAAESL